MWDLKTASELCKKIELLCPDYGCHVALTGGTLYKDGSRKDCDLLFYRIRQVQEIDWIGLFEALGDIGFSDFKKFGWVTKCKYKNLSVDIFNPEFDGIDVGTGSNGY
jgi:hypothetical protein